MKRQLTFCVLFLSLLTMTISRIPVTAAQTDVSPPTQATTSDLMAQASQNGHVRVIIALNLPFQAESGISAAQVSSQRILIQQTQQQVSDLLLGTDSETVATFETIPYITLDADAAAIQRLAESGLVRQIIKENVLRPLLAQSVPHIGAPAAWTAGYDGTGQTVAVLDTGVDKNHPFLNGKVVSEACYSLSGGDNAPLCPTGDVTGGMSRQINSGAAVPCTVEYCFHGTHVAGIVAGTNASFSGVAKSAKIIAIQVFHKVNNNQLCSSLGFAGAPCVLSSDSEVLSALERVYQLRSTFSIAAVNLSLGGGDFGAYCDLFFPYYYDMFAQLRSVGIAVIAGSGNSRYTTGIAAPACISNAISVGGTSDTSDAIWDDSSIFGASGSNSASILSLLAPGENITSSVSGPGGNYAEKDGTSMATPHVAGAFAVLRDAKPSATVDQILTALQNTGVPVIDPENGVTTPRIQVDAAAIALVANTLPTIGKIYINEIRVQTNQAIELYNAGASSVNMTGWKFIAYAANGSAETTYTFLSFTLNAGSYVILNKGTGSNTSTNLYMGNYSTAWNSNGSGAASLKSGNIGIDFVRWGTSTQMPPIATGWSGTNPAGPAAGQNLGRDPLTGDTDDGGDVSAQTPTLGGINQVTRPPNDNFANYAPVSAIPYTDSVATFTATRQTSEPNPSCAPDIGRTVWYRYIPTTSDLVGFDTIGSNFDTAMAVWTGSWGALTEVGCSEDITPGTFPQSKVVFTANAGITYYIQVGGYNGISGQLNFRIDVPMLNDEFSGAAVVSSLPYTLNQDTTTTTAIPDDPVSVCNGDLPNANTVWFRYTASASETIRFETTNSDYDTILSVWTGTNNDLTEVDCHDDQDPFFLTDLTSMVDVSVTAGTTYHIMIGGGIFGSSGNLIFKVKSMSPPPPGLNPPVLSTPTNGQTLNSAMPTFTWNLAFNATSYQLQFGTNAALTGDPITVVGGIYTLTSPLLTTTYYWRVRSLGTAGSMSAWSETRSLIVASAANAAPSQNFERTLPIHLTWASVDWALQYELQVDTENTFANPRLYNLFVPKTTPFVNFNQLNNGVYYWRVRALGANGRQGNWSSTERFTFDE